MRVYVCLSLCVCFVYVFVNVYACLHVYEDAFPYHVIIHIQCTHLTPLPPPKAALNGFSHTLATELHRYNIGVSVISPWYVRTPMTKHTHTDIIAHSPAGRLLESEEVAECVLRVCEMGVVMKGQEVVVDGVTDPLAGI